MTFHLGAPTQQPQQPVKDSEKPPCFLESMRGYCGHCGRRAEIPNLWGGGRPLARRTPLPKGRGHRTKPKTGNWNCDAAVLAASKTDAARENRKPTKQTKTNQNQQ